MTSVVAVVTLLMVMVMEVRMLTAVMLEMWRISLQHDGSEGECIDSDIYRYVVAIGNI